MLLGVEDEQVDAVIKVARTALPSSGDKKRATLFVVPVQHFEQI